eukprot:GILJ01006478.1.p1 GENE.GILJ01006478.1~~GILJ01006478.1.p1  ORF type:complete len:602 (+),score=134.75 GILJ01006478.1:43-1806(+)
MSTRLLSSGGRSPSASRLRSPSSSKRSLSDRSHAEEMEKVHDLWQRTKQSLQTKAQEISRKERAKTDDLLDREEDLVDSIYKYQNECQELKEKLHETGIQFDKLQEAHVQTKRHLADAKDETERYKDRLTRQMAINRTQSDQLDEMHRRLEEHNLTKQEVLNRSEMEVHTSKTELDIKQDEVDALNSTIRGQEESIQFLNELQEKQRRQNVSTADELAQKEQELQDARKKIRELEHALEMTDLQRRSEGTLLLEIEHFKMDNQRLTRLLQSTKEYKNFSENLDDFGGSRYLPDVSSTAEDEEEHWVPYEAFKIANSFQNKFKAEMTPDEIHNLLHELNNVWREREKRKIERVKHRYSFKLESMRRQLANRVPYNAIVLQQENGRLRKELQKAVQEAQNASALKATLKKYPPSMGFLDKTLKMASSLHHDRQALEDENKRLKERVTELMSLMHDGTHERVSFMDGATWMARRCLKQADASAAAIDDVIRDYNRKTVELHRSDPDYSLRLLKLQTWLLDSVEREMLSLREGLRALFEKHLNTFELQRHNGVDGKVDSMSDSTDDLMMSSKGSASKQRPASARPAFAWSP